MNRKILIWGGVVLTILISGAVYVYLSLEQPPVEEISGARLSLTDAEKVNRSPAAEVMFQNAVITYDSAMLLWQIENEKIAIFRNYDQVIKMAEETSRLAKESIERSRIEISDIRTRLLSRKKELTSQIAYYQARFSHIPLSKQQRNEWAKGRMLLQEGVFALNNQNYELCVQKFDSAELYIYRIISYSTQVAEVYFMNYPDWQRWTTHGIADSKKHKTSCIIVDKYERKCLLYSKGILQYEFDIELGPNWVGDKNHQGDKSTPEGVYKITRKKKNGETIYYKALLLNYPNDDDKKRFLQNKKNGTIARTATIGNLIEIHGRGGKGTDWTDGCIALTDADMDVLFASSQVGTAVIIVGSLKSFDEVITNK